MVTSSIVSTGKALARPSRRRMLVGCVGLTAAASLAPWVRAAVFARRQGELFAFTAPDRKIWFLLSPWAAPLGQANAINFRCGCMPEHRWMVEPYALREADASHNGARMFSGRVRCAIAATSLRCISSRSPCPPSEWPRAGSTFGPKSSEPMAGSRGSAIPLSRSSLPVTPGLHVSTRSFIHDGPPLARSRHHRRIAAGQLDPDAQARARRLADFVLPDTLWFDRAPRRLHLCRHERPPTRRRRCPDRADAAGGCASNR